MVILLIKENLLVFDGLPAIGNISEAAVKRNFDFLWVDSLEEADFVLPYDFLAAKKANFSESLFRP